MKTRMIFMLFLAAGMFFACNQATRQNEEAISQPEESLTGQWVRIGQAGPVGLTFTEDGMVEADFGNDQTVDAVASYELSGDTIRFIDQEGQMCQGQGLYRVYQTDYYVSFDLIDDECSGRIQTTMGFWTRPDFKDFLKTLEDEIANSPEPELYLNRARIYLATGNPKLAKDDFDEYLLADSLDARVYVNRAGTRFPDDLEGVVADSNRAILLDPDNKNAYFLRGLARYELGEHELGCEDFNKAIALGFSVLRVAEQEKCLEYWVEN